MVVGRIVWKKQIDCLNLEEAAGFVLREKITSGTWIPRHEPLGFWFWMFMMTVERTLESPTPQHLWTPCRNWNTESPEGLSAKVILLRQARAIPAETPACRAQHPLPDQHASLAHTWGTLAANTQLATEPLWKSNSLGVWQQRSGYAPFYLGGLFVKFSIVTLSWAELCSPTQITVPVSVSFLRNRICKDVKWDNQDNRKA